MPTPTAMMPWSMAMNTTTQMNMMIWEITRQRPIAIAVMDRTNNSSRYV